MLRKRKCRMPMGAGQSLDSRNKGYLVALPEDAKIVSKIWNSPVWLNQGRSWACTGFSVSMGAASSPVRRKGITKRVAWRLYKDAQRVDEWAGENYKGSSVQAAMKVACRMGWYEGYQWATSLEMLKLAIGNIGPAVLSIPWHRSMNCPDRNGFVRVVGRMVGRHAILCRGYNKEKQAFLLRQSAGRRWGLNGDCWIAEHDLWVLLQNKGSACIPIKRK